MTYGAGARRDKRDRYKQSTLSAGTCSIILSKKLVQQFGKYLNLKTKTSYNHLILLLGRYRVITQLYKLFASKYMTYLLNYYHQTISYIYYWLY